MFQKIVYLIEDESKAKDVADFMEVLSLNSNDMLGDGYSTRHVGHVCFAPDQTAHPQHTSYSNKL